MVKLEIEIPHALLPDLSEALHDLGYRGLTVTDITRHSAGAEGRRVTYRGRDFVPLEPGLRIELVIPGRRTEEALEMLSELVGPERDTRITVTPVLDVLRIRTGERGEDAVGG